MESSGDIEYKFEEKKLRAREQAAEVENSGSIHTVHSALLYLGQLHKHEEYGILHTGRYRIQFEALLRIHAQMEKKLVEDLGMVTGSCEPKPQY